MTVVESVEQVAWCLENIRRLYPEVPISVVSDGVDRPNYPRLVERFNVDYVRGEKLKLASKGGAWWQRVLGIGHSQNTDFVMKIDPDTKFQRGIEHWPNCDIAGTISGGKRREHIQGGIQLFTRQTVIRLLDSRFFEDDVLRDPITYAWDKQLLQHARKTGYLCSDAMLRAAKLSLRLKWCNWSEVHSSWKTLPKDLGKYAVTHPHKRKGDSHAAMNISR